MTAPAYHGAWAMGVHHHTLIVCIGIGLLIALAYALKPLPLTPSTPAEMIKLDVFESDAETPGAEPFAGPMTPTTKYFPRFFVREYSQGAQPIFTFPSGTAEKDLMSTSLTTRSNFLADTNRADLAAEMFLLIRSGDATVQPFTCPSGSAEKDLLRAEP